MTKERNRRKMYQLCWLCMDASNVLYDSIESEGMNELLFDFAVIVDECYSRTSFSQDELAFYYDKVKKLLRKAEQIVDGINNTRTWLKLDNIYNRCVLEEPFSEYCSIK